jgi:hypothetical protein
VSKILKGGSAGGSLKRSNVRKMRKDAYLSPYQKDQYDYGYFEGQFHCLVDMAGNFNEYDCGPYEIGHWCQATNRRCSCEGDLNYCQSPPPSHAAEGGELEQSNVRKMRKDK